MPAENTVSVYSTPAMSAEGEMEVLAESRPIRVSGFIALFLGLLSFVAVLGAPMIVVPVLAALIALFALRPYAGLRPAGYTAASIGLFAAVLFAVWGVTQRHWREQVLAQQAAQFASNWLDLIAQGDLELAVELQVHPSRRQAASMALSEYYSISEEGQRGMSAFREMEPAEDLIRAGNQVRWQLAQPPLVYRERNRELVRTHWKDQSGSLAQPLQVTLEYFPADDTQAAQWKIDSISEG